jgi:HD superfamily phosphohydrolase
MPKKPASPATEQMILSSKSDNTSEQFLSQPSFSDFDDVFEFQDDVHGPILLNCLERDVVDTPEFRRLFHLRQLGFVDLVYPTANHTRGTHSIGACHLAKMLTEKLKKNSKNIKISRAESVLISLGALLHDVPHGPLSHDIEKKTHRIYLPASQKPKRVKSHYGLYEKHDDFVENPALYVFLMDVNTSVLARVLRKYSPQFVSLLEFDSHSFPLLDRFASEMARSWPEHKKELLPSLIFHLLVYEKPDEAEAPSRSFKTSFGNGEYLDWGLGPKESREALHRTWYQPFRHDIIGDTLSADLLDYLLRDQSRLGMQNELDLKLLNHYLLVSVVPRQDSIFKTEPQYRCAIDLEDHKRGTIRAERLNDIFRLLDLRHQIHEKAVNHRVVQSTVAMLSRLGLIIGPSKLPSLKQLYGMDGDTPALSGDDIFLEKLISIANTTAGPGPSARASRAHRSLALKIAERRVYRPLMVIPGDRIQVLLRGICDFGSELEETLRELAAVVDSTYFSAFFLLISAFIEKLLQHAIDSTHEIDEALVSIAENPARLKKVRQTVPQRVIFWTTPYKQLYKEPGILVQVNGVGATTIDDLRKIKGESSSLTHRLDAGIRDAETKNEALWKLYVFLSDGLFYAGPLSKLRLNHPCAENPAAHAKHLEAAQEVVVRAIRFAWRYWQTRDKTIELSASIPDDAFSDLLKLFVAESGWFELGDTSIASKVSAVKISQYLHSESSAECRDVRYKFDADGSLETALQTVPAGEARDLVRQSVRALSIVPGELGSEELVEIITRLHAVGPGLVELAAATAARNSPVDESKLKELWLDDLQ